MANDRQSREAVRVRLPEDFAIYTAKKEKVRREKCLYFWLGVIRFIVVSMLIAGVILLLLPYWRAI